MESRNDVFPSSSKHTDTNIAALSPPPNDTGIPLLLPVNHVSTCCEGAFVDLTAVDL